MPGHLKAFRSCGFPATVIGVLLLAGCKADITYRVTVNPNDTATVSLKESFDSQFYQLAGSQGGTDPFGVEKARNEGWQVARTASESGDHVITLSKTIPLKELEAAVSSKRASPLAIPFKPNMTSTTGLFVDTARLSETIPALAAQRARRSDPFSGAGAAMASSIVFVHVELKTAGKVTATNGEATPDGAVRWNLSLLKPTRLEYATETPDVMHIAAAAALAVALVASAILLLVRRRSQPRSAAIRS